ncbi:MAG TPA: phage tail sheath family protein [Pyrinomonadaceae bacterium]|nr:phage tail sheath family protein [Pyrinomonadaceae bacterium]
MPEYLTPGVYIEEIERGPRPIEGVPTSTSAFLGETERGPLRPRLVTSFTEYNRWFGNVFRDGRYMPQAANGFFENGGKRLYVCRIVGEGVTTASRVFGDFTVTAAGPGAWGRNVWVKFEDGSTKDENGNSGFRMKLAYWSRFPEGFQPFDPFNPDNRNILPRPQYSEDFDDLSVDPNSSDFYTKRLIDASTNQTVSALVRLDSASSTPAKPPLSPATGNLLDQNGADDPNDLGADDFQGAIQGGRDQLQGLNALELDPFRDVALVYAPHPPANPVDIVRKVIDHCEKMRFRFAAIDSPRDAEPGSLNPRQTNKWDTSYAAFYTPWITISDPLSGARRTVPPGGHVLGVYARTDTERGVFKAPANEIVRGALDLRFEVNDNTQSVLNPQGVNVIRSFPSRGIRVWGARTLSSNGLWKYVSVRRLFIFLERSIYEGTQWVVFEPNDDRLWARVTDTIRLFLRTQWRLGALFGRTEQEAFFITCDRTTMTQDDILNGRLICEIGIAPVRPAEFVIFRIFQNTAEAQR